MVELCDEALVHAAGDDAREARIFAYRTGFKIWVTDVRAGLADARAALERAERVGDPRLLAAAISRVGLAETYAAEVTPGILERGVELEETPRPRLGVLGKARAIEYSRLTVSSGRDRAAPGDARGP